MQRRILDSKYALPFTLSLLAFILYSYTLSPSINFGDSPELISAAYNLGIAHPPGYPLYSLIGKAFSFVPVGSDTAGRVNLLSAFFAAASVFMAVLLTLSLDGKRAATGVVFVFLVMALSPTLWSQSVISEVYSLNLFIIITIAFLLMRWIADHDIRFLYTGAFICGLGLGNHHTLLSMLPLILAAPLIAGEKSLKYAKVYFIIVLLFFFGLTVYIYLPLRSMQTPQLDWGDPESVERFFNVVLRRQFPTSDGALTLTSALRHTGWYLKELGTETGYPLMLLAFFGNISLFLKNRRFWTILTLPFIVNGLFTVLFLNPSEDNYVDVIVMLIPSFAIAAIWAGIAINKIMEGISNKTLGGIITVFLAAAVIYSVPGKLKAHNHRNDYFAIDMAENIFKSAGKNSVIFVESDNSLFPLWYIQQVEGRRRDVAVIDVDFMMLTWFKKQMAQTYPNLDIPVEDLAKHSGSVASSGSFGDMLDSYKAAQVESVVKKLIKTRPLYLSYEFGPVYWEHSKDGHFVIEHGLLYRIDMWNSPPDMSSLKDYRLRSIMDYEIPKTPFIKAFSLAYLRAMQVQARSLAMEGKKGEAKLIIERMKEIQEEAASLIR